MIYIKQDKSKIIPGGESLFIYLEESINDAKVFLNNSFDLFYYDKKALVYELPLTDLAFILDSLTKIDDIYLILSRSKTESSTNFNLTVQAKLQPKKHQLQAVEYGIANKNFLLLDAPGLGKTFSSILLAEELHNRGLINKCLVICGIASLKQNWKLEIIKSSNLSCRINGEHVSKTGTISYKTIKERKNELNSKYDDFFTIINVESIRLSKANNYSNNIIKELIDGPNKFDMIIFDECHKCKDSESQAAKGLLQLNAAYKVAMTGTYLLNSPIDAYLSLVWLGFERPHNLTRFKKLYCVMDQTMHNAIVGFKNLELLKYQVSQHSLRRTVETLKSDGADIKEKYEETKYLEMNQDQSKFYKLLEKSVKTEYSNLAKEACDLVKLKTTNLLALMTRLRQAAVSPSILTSDSISSVKIDYATDLVEQIASHGNKVVILSVFKQPLELLFAKLNKYKPLLITGDSKEDYIANAMNYFQNDDEHMVWLGTHAKSGTGLTLNKAHYLIMLDTPWTYGLYEQSADRIYRINNESSAIIYNLVCLGTVDQFVEKLLKKKAELSDSVIQETYTEINGYLEDL